MTAKKQAPTAVTVATCPKCEWALTWPAATWEALPLEQRSAAVEMQKALLNCQHAVVVVTGRPLTISDG